MSLSLQGHGNVFTINFDSLLLGIFRLLLSPRAGSVRREENGRTKVKENSDDKKKKKRERTQDLTEERGDTGKCAAQDYFSDHYAKSKQGTFARK